MNAQVVGIQIAAFVREENATKTSVAAIALTPQQQKSVLNFIKHRVQGGQLKLTRVQPEQERRIIVPP